MQTISFFYDDHKKVRNVLAELEEFGVSASATKLVACDADEHYRSQPSGDDSTFGALVGLLIGCLPQFISAGRVQPRSGTMITVQTTDEQAAFVQAILRSGLSIDKPKRLGGYQTRGWTMRDSFRGAIAPIEISRERSNFLS